MSHPVTATPADLIPSIVPPTFRVLHVHPGDDTFGEAIAHHFSGYVAAPADSLDGSALPGEPFDAVVALGVFERIIPDDAYVWMARRLIGALKPGGVLVVHEHNPVEGASADPADYGEGDIMPRGMHPLYAQSEVHSMQVLGQEFDDHFCAGLWLHPCKGLVTEDAVVEGPESLMVERIGGKVVMVSSAPSVVAVTGELMRRAADDGYLARDGDLIRLRFDNAEPTYRIVGWRNRGEQAVCALEES